MTARDVYEGALFELNKVHAPALTVEEFVYFLNKAILAYVNERYNFYAVNQQLSDDLRVLLTEFQIAITAADIFTDLEAIRYVLSTLNATNYLHILSCDLIVRNTISNNVRRYTTKRLTLDMFGAIHNNEYLKPAINRPYFLLLPTNTSGEQNNSVVKIFIGDAIPTIVPSAVRIYYLRLPVLVTLTDNQVFNLAVNDPSIQVLEFPDYLKNEFVKRVVLFQLEETRDTRVQSFPSFNQEIPTIPMEMSGGQPQQPQQQQQS